MRRRAIDFTSYYEIVILQSAANPGKFWSQIVHEARRDRDEWEQIGLSDSRAEALAAAESAMDKMAEAFLSQGEPDEQEEYERARDRRGEDLEQRRGR